MADTGLETSDALTVKQWDDQLLYEYQDRLYVKEYMGDSAEDMIQVRDVFKKEAGDEVTFGLLEELSGEGVEDDDTLEGNEEEQQYHDFAIRLRQFRHAIRSKGRLSARRTKWDLKKQFKPSLANWASQKTEQHIFNDLAAMGSGTELYSASSEETKDAYLADNADRFLFGAAVSNNSSNDHSASLSNVDGTNDILSTAIISLAKRRAQLADPKIRPIKIDNGEEWYVMFVHPLCARDLKNTDAWKNAQQYARERGKDNPLFTGALGAWDGVIVREAPKCMLLDGVGASSIDVAANFLCGAQALCFAPAGNEDRMDAQMTMTEETFDYKNKVGVAVEMMYAHGKAIFNDKQHGVVTVYCAAVED
jgi:N4-gp56 family major capsid protein